MFKQSNNLKWTCIWYFLVTLYLWCGMYSVHMYVYLRQIWSDTFFSKKVNPKTKYGYVMTVFAPFLNPNFHLPLFYRLLLPWTAWIASGFKYLLGWAEQQEACEVFSPYSESIQNSQCTKSFVKGNYTLIKMFNIIDKSKVFRQKHQITKSIFWQFFNIVMQQSAGQDLLNVHYGNTGCGVFKRGVQN